ncbi:MAG: putative DNA binding domain-containing protein [Bifidobacteriaceae bacterium]|jgi:predicted HTH transcriptional regulator|nr:putative DNA binding domain-containing protein [Bifidobacteriaceae bacterium]
MPFALSLDEAGRVAEPEGKTREYKLNLGSPDRALRSVVAFANSAGGQLVVGVRDDGTVVGVADPLVEQERLAHLIADSVRPQLASAIELVTVAGKTLVVADVVLGSQRPYHLRSAGRAAGVFYRSAAGNVQAGPSMVAELERSAQGISFDKLPCAGGELADLDLSALSKLLGREMDEAALRSGNLACVEPGRTIPTNAGVLVGSPHPERLLPHARVQCARFRGPRRRDITDQAEILGPLPLAVDKVLDFLRRNAFLSAEFSDGPRRRTDVWSIPVAPLKELIVNGLVHSSWADHGTPLKVAFLDDEIRIESPGGLRPGMTVEQMKRGESSIRNPVLASIFKDLGLIEAWGTGIPEVLADLAALGLPEPGFEEGHERLKITVHIQSHDPLRYRVNQLATANPPDRQEEQPEKQDEQAEKQHETPSKQDDKQAEQRKRQDEAADRRDALGSLGRRGPGVIAAVRGGPASRREILAAVGLTDDYRAFARHIAPLVEAGLLARTLPGASRARTQRYVLTAAGRAAAALLEESGLP